MITTIPIQDWFSMFDKLRVKDYGSERINNPSNPKNYWGYRMHVTVEELLRDNDFIETIRSLVKKYSREVQRNL